MQYPFEVPFEEVESHLETHVDAVFSCLQSEFLRMPKGPDFIEYPVFARGYESLKKATKDFRDLSPASIVEVVYETPIALTVLRTMLGITPSEWAYITTERTAVTISQTAARNLDRTIRRTPETRSFSRGVVTKRRIQALVETASALLIEGTPQVPDHLIHRLNKADTQDGAASIQHLADFGAPYAMVLYERYLGRPFAGHRDSVSELVGDVVETAIERALYDQGISFRKTGRAERIPNFDQAPDFIIPDEFNPQVVIEAKVTEDDGTARDKVTRIQHLGELSTEGLAPGLSPKFEVVAAIAGRGFKVRREDMKKLLIATRGKVFTLQNIDRLIECTNIRKFRTRSGT